MKTDLAGNIIRLRRERSLTQEQLAEALGVSCAAVSKWERGAAVPELRLIVELADLFEVSVDGLIGYVSGGNNRESMVAELKEGASHRSSEALLETAEKALRRYPDDFETVYYSAENYNVRAVCTENQKYARRSVALYEHALRLIRQNTDPSISETRIRREEAILYISLNETEAGIRILKEHNPCRLNHALIGKTLAAECDDPDGALPYLSEALLDETVMHMQIVIGFLNVFFLQDRYEEAEALLKWGLSFFEGLRCGDAPNCMDKAETALLILQAEVKLRLQDPEAAESLRCALKTAERFDAAPDYSGGSLRFAAEDTPGSSVDNLGETAVEGVEKMIKELGSEALTALRRKL